MTSVNDLRVGLLGLDSPHSRQFVELLGTKVPGARVVVAHPGAPSEDLPISRDRVDELSAVIREAGVPVTSRLDDLLDVDLVLATALDPRSKTSVIEPVLAGGVPVFMDTRPPSDPRDLDRLLATAARSGATLHAASPKLYMPEMEELTRRASAPQISRLELFGPLPPQPPLGRFGWYGVHLVWMAFALFGLGGEVVDDNRLRWPDGRTAVLHERRQPGRPVTVELSDGVDPTTTVLTPGPAMLTGLLTALLDAHREDRTLRPTSEVRAVAHAVAALDRTHPAPVLGP